MFGNFIYFILVLLIYLTYQPSDETYFTGFESFTLFICLILIFSFFTRFQFQRIESRISKGKYLRIDHQFSSTLLHQSIMAIVLFAINIYGLNLSSFLADIPPFKTIPTLLALLFLLLFIFYLAIVWYFAFGPYQSFTRPISRDRPMFFQTSRFQFRYYCPGCFCPELQILSRPCPLRLPKDF